MSREGAEEGYGKFSKESVNAYALLTLSTDGKYVFVFCIHILQL